MNGARAEPSARARTNPSVRRKTTMGASHHFLRTRRKLQNSRRIESLAFILELFFVIGGRGMGRAWLPVSRLVAPETKFKWALSAEALQEADGRHDQEKEQRQDYSGKQPAQGKGHGHPGSINVTQDPGSKCRGQEQESAERKKRPARLSIAQEKQ